MTKNTRTLLGILLIVAVMGGLAFASVPLYRLFCQVTGFGGTTQTARQGPHAVLDRQITVRFNADISPNLPWEFKPEERAVTVNVGQEKLIAYRSRNKAPVPVAGTALFNVTPDKAGRYFHKIQCFCFDNQTLAAGQEMQMPVVFYLDPALAEDENMDDVTTVTLSYTFYPADSKELDAALEGFYNGGEADIQNGVKPLPDISN